MSLFRRKSEKNKTPPSAKSTAKYKNSASPLPGVYDRTQNDNHVSDYDNDKQSPAIPTPSGLLLFHDDNHPGDLGVSLGSTDAILEKKSRLSKNLYEFIQHREAIPHLIHYLEDCKAGALIRFWLDADSFQASTWTRIRTHSLNTVSKSSLIKWKESAKQPKVKEKDITSPNSQSTDADSTCEKSDSLNLTPLDREKGHSNLVCNTDSTIQNDSETERTDSNYDVADNYEIVNSAASERNSLGDDDQRTREKCKTETSTNRLSLSLDLQDKHISSGHPLSLNSIDSGAHSVKSTSSAVSMPELGCERIVQTASATKLHESHKDQLADKLKKSIEQDAVRIFTKYLALEATHPISVTDELRNETIRKICREDGEVDPECFVDCQKFVLDKIDKEYYDGFKLSVYYCKHQVDILTGDKVYLNDILYNQTALFYFMEYMEREGLSHLLQFLVAADNFEELLAGQETYDSQQAQDDAMVLYDKYFSLQAANPLGFPDSVRFDVEGNICREEGPLPDCFAKPRAIILQTIEKVREQVFIKI